MATKYYISTGDHNGFYTLRYVLMNQGRDFYIQNLSRDWIVAFNKAAEIATENGGKLITDISDSWKLNEWGAGKTGQAKLQKYYLWMSYIQDGKMPFGKHFGQDIADLPSGYRNWLRTETDDSQAWKLLDAELAKYAEIDGRIEAEKAEIREKVNAARAHIGRVGEKVATNVTCVSKIPYHGMYGYGSISVLLDENGNKIKTFGKCDLQLNESGSVKFTVKSHDEYRGEKQTTVVRMKIL